jgi:hypothetical protein
MSFLPFFSFCLLAQGLEPLIPERLEEVAQADEALGPGAIEPARAVPALAHQRRPAQHTQVLRDGGAGDVGEVGGDRAGRKLVLADEPKDLAPVWLGDGLDGILHYPGM